MFPALPGLYSIRLNVSIYFLNLILVNIGLQYLSLCDDCKNITTKI